jgi:hypothetical protein
MSVHSGQLSAQLSLQPSDEMSVHSRQLSTQLSLPSSNCYAKGMV